MTQPLAHGYPDWGRFAASADKIYDSRTNLAISVGTDFGPHFVGDVPAVGFRFSAPIGNFVFGVFFYDDALQTNLLTSYVFSVQQSQDTRNIVPVRGPYMVFYVEPGAANRQCTFRVMSSHVLTQGDAPLSNSSTLISMVGSAVGAGASITALPASLYPGPATWHARSALATWTCVIESVDYLGAVSRLDYVDNTYPKNERLIYLPMRSARAVFTNTTAAAGTFDLFMNAHPLRPIG